MELGDRHALLLGAVAVTDGDGIVFQSLVIYRDTERSSNQVLARVTLANGSRVFVDDVEIVLEEFHDLLPFFG
jgi:hypothetical protein